MAVYEILRFALDDNMLGGYLFNMPFSGKEYPIGCKNTKTPWNIRFLWKKSLIITSARCTRWYPG
jgi:hypothetical protein